MYNEIPSANKKGPPPKPDHRYKFDPINATNNQILDSAAEHLELIYKTIDWPFTTPVDPNLKVSLYQSGKSRADLWQFAGLVALEKTLERSNRACDLDYHARQQVCSFFHSSFCETLYFYLMNALVYVDMYLILGNTIGEPRKM